MIRNALTGAACIVVGLAAAVWIIAGCICGSITAAELEDRDDDGHPWQY